MPRHQRRRLRPPPHRSNLRPPDPELGLVAANSALRVGFHARGRPLDSGSGGGRSGVRAQSGHDGAGPIRCRTSAACEGPQVDGGRSSPTGGGPRHLLRRHELERSSAWPGRASAPICSWPTSAWTRTGSRPWPTAGCPSRWRWIPTRDDRCARASAGIRSVLIDVNVGLPRGGCAPEAAGAWRSARAGRRARGARRDGLRGTRRRRPRRRARADAAQRSMEILAPGPRRGGRTESSRPAGRAPTGCNEVATEIQAGSYALLRHRLPPGRPRVRAGPARARRPCSTSPPTTPWPTAG